MGVIAVVVAGGPLELPWVGAPPPFEQVIAVDGGLDAALQAGLRPTVLLGDLDSVSPAALRWAHDCGLTIIRHPTDKNDTDTALALASVSASDHLDQVDVVLLGAATTDRFDHLLGSLAALGTPELAAARSITAHLGGTAVHVLHPGARRALRLGAGRTLSLLALHGPCTGVSIAGVRWPLADATLPTASTLGISNETVLLTVTVTVTTGVLTLIVPPPFAPGQSEETTS